MSNIEESSKLLSEAYEHLWQGRYRMALSAAQKAYEEKPEDYNAAICCAWALLENGQPAKALELANFAVESGGDSLESRLFRGYFLTRMSIFEGAKSDLEISIKKLQSLLVFSLHNQAKSLAGMGQYAEATDAINKAFLLESDISAYSLISGSAPSGKEASVKDVVSFYSAALYERKLSFSELLSLGIEAFNLKEFWFSLYASRKILVSEEEDSQLFIEASLLELEAMNALFQYRPALEKAEKLRQRMQNNDRFINIVSQLGKAAQNRDDDDISAENEDLLSTEYEDIGKEEITDESSSINNPHIINISKRIDFQNYNNSFARFTDIKMFDVLNDHNDAERKYLLQYDEQTVRITGAEVIFENPRYMKGNYRLVGKSLWYLDDELVSSEGFSINIESHWKNVAYICTFGDESYSFWHKGQGRIEIVVGGEKVCERYFLVGSSEIIQAYESDIETNIGPATESLNANQTDNVKDKTEYLRKTRQSEHSIDVPEESLPDLLLQLDSLTGLESLKNSVHDFISYLDFINERQKMGLKTKDALSVHLVFTGNPGTGKTTVARLLGKIFRAMGILENGHVVEIDRSGLVGQYIGETAIKTDKVVKEAYGGILFIDEAYTLSPQNSAVSNDFGQEAIDTLLKRMEDNSGKFIIIAAGYPEEMKRFIESNPGLKSRFTHYFTFEDYSPDELLSIFEQTAAAEEYSVSKGAIDLLKKYLTALYRERDKTFGNARIVRNLFNDAKMNLGKRYLNSSAEDKTKENLTTIRSADIEAIVTEKQKKHVKIDINHQKLDEYMQELQSMTGLESVKKSVEKLISGLKVAKMREQRGLLNIEKNLHSVFLGNPGTGKTTVARLLSKIYKEMGLLEKGHLVEVDRAALVAGYQGQTAIKTDNVIKQAIGGTLFIDEAYTLWRGGQDFGQEAIDTILKRMEDYRGQFVIIAAGYPEEMNYFLNSNPGLQSRFNNTFVFEDYTPRQLLEIANQIASFSGYKFDEGALQSLLDIFSDSYKKRDKSFGNARTARTVLYEAISNQEERISKMYNCSDEDLTTIIVDDVNKIINCQW